MVALGPSIALASGIGLVLLGGLLLLVRPVRGEQLFFGLFAVLWGTQVVGANVGLVADDASLFTAGFLVAHAVIPPAILVLAQFAARVHGGRWAWLLPAAAGTVAGAAGLLLLARPSLVLEQVARAPDGGLGGVTLGPASFPLFWIPFFATFYLALVVLYQRYRQAAPGSPRHRYRGMLLALALFTSYQSVTNLSIFLGIFEPSPVPGGFGRLLAAATFIAGAITVAAIVGHLWLRPPQPDGRDPWLLAAFLVPAFVALGTELIEPLRTGWRSWGLWRLASVAVLVHAIARYRLFDLDLRLKRLAGPGLAAGLALVGAAWSAAIVNDASLALAGLPLVAGLTGAGALIASRDHIGEALFPGVADDTAYIAQRKREVYRAALERVLEEGGDPSEDRVLTDLRESLGISKGIHDLLVEHASDQARTTASHPGPVTPGALFADRYRVGHVLGEGAHGRALSAYDTEARQDVVLKVVGLHALGGQAATLLEEEHKVLASLDHPNIVEVHDVIHTPHEVVLVLEHLPGGDLAGLLKRRGRLSIHDACTILDDVLAGLHAAHEAGIVHRDLKPGNVLLTTDERAKLADFGIAAQRRDTPSTEAGGVAAATAATAGPAGTLLYMAPEQVRGQAATPATDLYAAGALLHLLLTGRLPVRTAGADDFTIRHRILHDPPALSLSGQPDWVRPFLKRALGKDPDDRFGDAEQMRRALEARVTAMTPSATG